MKYIVVSSFKDLEDNEHVYRVGDTYPREGKNIEDISKERIEQLTTTNNKRGRVLIKEIGIEEGAQEPEATEEPKVEETAEPEATEEPKVEETAEPETTEEPKVEETAEPEQTEESKANTNAKNTRKRN